MRLVFIIEIIYESSCVFWYKVRGDICITYEKKMINELVTILINFYVHTSEHSIIIYNLCIYVT